MTKDFAHTQTCVTKATSNANAITDHRRVSKTVKTCATATTPIRTPVTHFFIWCAFFFALGGLASSQSIWHVVTTLSATWTAITPTPTHTIQLSSSESMPQQKSAPMIAWAENTANSSKAAIPFARLSIYHAPYSERSSFTNCET